MRLAQYLRRLRQSLGGGSRRSSRPEKVWRPELECLENRLVPAGFGDPYPLVLDMATQPAGNDGVADRIEARRSGGNIELLVNEKIVRSASLFGLSSVIIRGSNDPDAVRLAGDLRVPVTVDG